MLQRSFLALVAMLLASYLGNTAFVVIFVGVLSLRRQNIFQEELAWKTEEAETDPLTKTYNMRYLRRWLRDEVGTFKKESKSCSFIFVDVDGLKAVNDKYDHATGNDLLIHITEVLTGSVRSEDRIARYGGDEFVIACPNTDLPQATQIATRILRASSENPFWVGKTEVAFGLSIGVATWPDHGETTFDVIRMADRAMYLAKKSGGNKFRSAATL